MSRVYLEENELYQIDLRTAIWSKGDLHDLYKCIGHILSDVDFIAETENAVFLIEYKNTEVENARDHKSFAEKMANGVLIDNMVKKYYGSAFYILACEKKKPIHFIAVIESKLMEDSFMRRRIEASIKRRLPFDLQKNQGILSNLIVDFKILSISEWNKQYPMFPIQKC